jgi:hypothetical protein
MTSLNESLPRPQRRRGTENLQILRRTAVVLLLLALTLYPASALAQQARIRVTADRTNIWRPGFTVVAVVAQAGDVLDVVRRQGNWYEVVIPSSELQRRETGFIAVSRVELIEGVPGSAPPPASPRTAPRQSSASSRQAAPPAATGFSVFGIGGYGWFTANDSFSAVLGKPGGPWFGGGAQFRFNRRYFVEAAAEHFQATGERVFVLEKNVYPLGIADKVSLTPLIALGGVRIPGRSYTTYVGGGAGVYLVRETSDFATDDENVKETKAAYRGLVGFEWPIARHASAAFELQYTAVPDGLTGSVATAFDESDLGGFQIRGRISFGR